MMTIEDRYLADVSDLRTIRLECVACGAAVALPVTGIVPVQCPGCHQPWMIVNAPEHTAIQRIIRGLRDVAAATTDGAVKYRVRFELERPR
jgi:hypothetical protein